MVAYAWPEEDRVRRIIYLSFVAMLFQAGAAQAGLFDDLQKMQNQMKQLQQGGGLKAPSTGGGGITMPSTGAVAGTQAGSADSGICGGESKKKLECVCRSQFIEGGQVNREKVLKNLPSANAGLLKADFSGDIQGLNARLNQPMDASNAGKDVLNLNWYTNAFESPEFSVVYDQLLRTTEKADMISQIKQAADKKAGFSESAQTMKRDAQQAYGVILLYYQGAGASASSGLKYLMAAAKSGPTKAFIATYQLGHRAFMGIGEKRNLSKAANWMLKSYEAIQARELKEKRAQTAMPINPAFANLVKEEFTSLVSQPDYARRKQYAQLMQQAEQMRQEMTQMVKDAKGQSPDLVAIERAYLTRLTEIHAMLLRAAGGAQKATALEERALKFKQDRDWSDEKSKDLRISMPGTDEFINEVINGMGNMSAQQEKEFDAAMKSLAVLVTDMDQIGKSLLARFANGEISMGQMAANQKVLGSVSENCRMLALLNGELKKKGKPQVAISDIGQDSDSIDLEIPG